MVISERKSCSHSDCVTLRRRPGRHCIKSLDTHFLFLKWNMCYWCGCIVAWVSLFPGSHGHQLNVLLIWHFKRNLKWFYVLSNVYPSGQMFSVCFLGSICWNHLQSIAYGCCPLWNLRPQICGQTVFLTLKHSYFHIDLMVFFLPCKLHLKCPLPSLGVIILNWKSAG